MRSSSHAPSGNGRNTRTLDWVVLTTMGAAQRGRLDLSQSLVRACQKSNPAREKPSTEFCGPRRAFRRKPRRFSEIRAQNSFLSS
jgi:hypothetical protein